MTDTPVALDRLVIFGATGDLAGRMLLPSLYFLEADGLLPPTLKIFGAARSELDHDAFLALVRADLVKRAPTFDEAVFERFCQRLTYCQSDVTSAAGPADPEGCVGRRLGGVLPGAVAQPLRLGLRRAGQGRAGLRRLPHRAGKADRT